MVDMNRSWSRVRGAAATGQVLFRFVEFRAGRVGRGVDALDGIEGKGDAPRPKPPTRAERQSPAIAGCTPTDRPPRGSVKASALAAARPRPAMTSAVCMPDAWA